MELLKNYGRSYLTDSGKLNGGSVLGLGQFSILPQLPSKIMLDSKVVKIDLKIIISLCLSKSVTKGM
jgi:hypothetical protein